MGKLVRVNGKGQKWKKGQSCVSNAPNTKHREFAKGRFFQKLEGESGLTQDALAEHNKSMVQISNQLTGLNVEEEDVQSGGKTFNTFATTYTNCTLPVFNRFFLKFDKDSEKHKRMLAVHAAVQEYMTEQNIPETNISYCSALFVSARGVMESEEDVEATLCLLTKVIKKVPINNIRATVKDYTDLLRIILQKYRDSSNQSIIEKVIGSLSVILRALDQPQWNKYYIDAFKLILEFTVDERHKIRKSAQYNTAAILNASSFMLSEDDIDEAEKMDADDEEQQDKILKKKQIVHPATESVTVFIEQLLCSPNDTSKRKQTLHLLVLLRQIIMTFPKLQLKKVCEWILSVMQIGDPLVNISALQVLFSLYCSEPPAEVLNVKTNVALIRALISNEGAMTSSGISLIIVPNMNDKAYCKVWIDVVCLGLLNLFINDETKGIEYICSYCEMLLTFWKSEEEEIHQQVFQAFELLLDSSFGRLESRVLEEQFKSKAQSVIAIINNGLSLQYQRAWDYVFKTLGSAFLVLGKYLPEDFTKSLNFLCSHVNTTEITNQSMLEHTIGNAITGLGPKFVAIDILKLQISGNIKDDEKCFWVLPLLKKYVKKTQLKLFIIHFMPLAIKCNLVLNAIKQKGKEKSIMYKAYETVEIQIWAMLSSFALDATDIDEALLEKGFPKMLGDLIKNRSDTRIDILQTIRHLINGNQTRMKDFAKNYLPILFNLYRPPAAADNSVVVCKGHQLAAYETIKAFSNIVSEDISNGFFRVILDKFKEEKDAKLLDLAKAFLHSSSTTYITEVKELILQLLESNEEQPVKKATYKLLEEMLNVIHTKDANAGEQTLKEFAYAIANSLSTTKNSSRAPRLKCLKVVFQHITSDMNQQCWREFLQFSAGEIITCCGKKQSVAVKKAAFDLLSELGATVQKIEQCSVEETITHSLKLLLAGLNGSPTLISNTIITIASIAYQYKDMLNVDDIKLLMESVLVLMSNKAHEVKDSCLTFIKASLKIFPITLYSDFVDKVIDAICSLDDLAQKKFRLKTRDIFSVLIRKFGAERISALVPKDNEVMQKRIRAIRKLEARKKKNKDKEDDSDDSDQEEASRIIPPSINEILNEIDTSDDEDAKPDKKKNQKKKDPKQTKKSKSKDKKGTWIMEEEDDIVDLLDSSVSQKISSKAPSKPKIASKSEDKPEPMEEFPIDKATGKLIITEVKRDKKEKSDLTVEDYDSYMHMRSGALEGKIKNKKRKATDSAIDEDDIEEELLGKNKKAGKRRKFDYGSEYKAKKAGGDVKVQGKADPYAYVPFSKDRLNRRKKAKYAGQLKTLVKGAKRGAAKGHKLRKPNKK